MLGMRLRECDFSILLINNQLLKHMDKKRVSLSLAVSPPPSLSPPTPKLQPLKLQPLCRLAIIIKVSSNPPTDLHCENTVHRSLL